MENILKELYTGEMPPFGELPIRTARYRRAQIESSDAETRLLEKFPECDSLFTAYQNARAELIDETVYQQFVFGIKVGAQLMKEMLEKIE